MSAIIDELETIDLPLSSGVRNITNIYNEISEVFQKEKSVSISIPDEAEADLSFIQMIQSARSHAKSLGIQFSLKSPAGKALAAVLARGGFTENFSKDDNQFWFHSEAVR